MVKRHEGTDTDLDQPGINPCDTQLHGEGTQTKLQFCQQGWSG